MSKISRRTFLKVIGSAAPALFFPKVSSWAGNNIKQSDTSKPNVIIILLDAMSARNLSVYGYPRPTTPNLERFAEHALVYHSHYSSGNYTIPGTASLLTGTYPWTHRAINHSGMVKQSMIEENIFRAVGEGYRGLAFPQNVWSNLIVSQFADDIDTLIPSGTYGDLDYLAGDLFSNDVNTSTRALDDFAFKEREQASLIFGPLLRALYFRNAAHLPKDGYPNGLPNIDRYPLYFKLEDVFDGLASLLPGLQHPSFAYIHLYPPHGPYRATSKFDGQFNDGWDPIAKPVHRFSEHSSGRSIASERRAYDEYLASIDWELGNLFDTLEKEGVFEKSYVIVTSDHGEMFERGQVAHTTPLLYEPVMHIPLLISTPGQKTRRDVYAPTNAVDVLPTIAQLTGNPTPSWTEGVPLPELGGVEDYERSIFTVEAKKSSAFKPLDIATVALREGTHKLIYYTGYEAEDSFELYDLEVDTEELNDLYPAQPAIAKKMKDKLLDTFSDVNKPYLKQR